MRRLYFLYYAEGKVCDRKQILDGTNFKVTGSVVKQEADITGQHISVNAHLFYFLLH